MTQNREAPPLSGEILFADLLRHIAEHKSNHVYRLPPGYLGARVVAQTIDAELHIGHGVWGHPYSERDPGYISDSKSPWVSEASGSISDSHLFGPNFILTLDTQEGRSWHRRDVRYYVPLLGRDAQPLVELSIEQPAD